MPKAFTDVFVQTQHAGSFSHKAGPPRIASLEEHRKSHRNRAVSLHVGPDRFEGPVASRNLGDSGGKSLGGFQHLPTTCVNMGSSQQSQGGWKVTRVHLGQAGIHPHQLWGCNLPRATSLSVEFSNK